MPSATSLPSATFAARMSSPQNSDNDEVTIRARMLTAAGLALGVPMTVLASFLVGYWLDRQLQTAPLWFFLLGIAGMVSSARLLYRMWQQLR